MSDATSNSEFYDLLNSVTSAETFSLTLTDAKEYTFKQLSTSQLKDLIKTVVDSPLTQAVYNNAVSKIMKDSLVTEGVDASLFNVVDRLLFTLETRIQSISPTITVTNEDKSVEVNLASVKQKLVDSIAADSSKFTNQTFKGSSIEVSYGLPLLKTESQLNDELYKDVTLNIENQEELRKILGETFVNEIAKTVQTITVADKVLDLSSVNFKSRLKTIESLPASLVNSVIEYIEKYKKIVEESLLTDAGISIPIDGSLFSLR